jgi:amino acid transporter
VKLPGTADVDAPLVKRPLLFLWAPLLALLIALPISTLLFEEVVIRFSAFSLIVVGPSYLGLVAAPGYGLALFRRASWLHANWQRRLWLRASLFSALACSAAGLYGGFLMILFLPPSLWTFIQTLVLWFRYERAGRALRRAAP